MARDIYLCETKRAIAQRLASKNKETNSQLFPTYAHLAIFAASVTLNKKLKPKKITKRGIEVPSTVFVGNNEFDKVIDLMVLGSEKNIESIDEENEKDNYQLFESLVNTGLIEINKWFSPKNDFDEIGLDTLYKKILANAPKKSAKLDPGTINR